MSDPRKKRLRGKLSVVIPAFAPDKRISRMFDWAMLPASDVLHGRDHVVVNEDLAAVSDVLHDRVLGLRHVLLTDTPISSRGPSAMDKAIV